MKKKSLQSFDDLKKDQFTDKLLLSKIKGGNSIDPEPEATSIPTYNTVLRMHDYLFDTGPE